MQQTLFEVLMCLQDPTTRMRAAALDPRASAVGCGWRKRTRGEAVTVLITATVFEELDAIHSRSHLPLQEVRRLLPLACKNSVTTVVQLKGGYDVELISPISHPIECGNEVAVLLRVGEDIQICSTLLPDEQSPPAAPVAASGDIFQQFNIDGLFEVRALIPSKGLFRLHLFARHTASSGFHHIGAVRINAAQWHVTNTSPGFPITTSNFDDRRCTLVGPMEGTLVCDAVYTFDIVVPKSLYLKADIERITTSLESSNLPDERSSQAAIQGLEAEVAAAEVKYHESSTNLNSEIALLNASLAKKKGKDLERARAQIAELSEELKSVEADMLRSQARLAEAKSKEELQRRARKRAEAQKLRFAREKELFTSAADRSVPLSVLLSLEERRAEIPPADADFTHYVQKIRVPRGSAPLSLFINGLAVVTWNVAE
jgi:hypothetical protein